LRADADFYLVEIDAFGIVEGWDVVAFALYEPVVAEEDACFFINVWFKRRVVSRY